MIYIKSTLVGVVTLFAATIVYIAYRLFILMRMYSPPPGGMIRISLPELLNRPMYWLIAPAAFAIGFYWECRRT